MEKIFRDLLLFEICFCFLVTYILPCNYNCARQFKNMNLLCVTVPCQNARDVVIEITSISAGGRE